MIILIIWNHVRVNKGHITICKQDNVLIAVKTALIVFIMDRMVLLVCNVQIQPYLIKDNALI